MSAPFYDKDTILNFPTYGYQPVPFDTENLDFYCPGGFHPIIVGDVLGGRYQAMHKLGHGGYATVWLCYDKVEGTWKAVKVVMACASNNKTSPELSILKYFEGVSDDVLEEKHLCLPRKNFFVDGPNGRHLCIVMPVLGRTLHDALQSAQLEDSRLSFCSVQLACAMEFLHSKGVCHGDFRPRNILFKLDDVDKVSIKQMMGMVGKARRMPVPPPPTRGGAAPGPHLPAYIYPASALNLPCTMTTPYCVVTDFGEAYHVGSAPETTGIPLTHCAPEIILPIRPLGFGADIWALGNTICEIRMGSSFIPQSDFNDREFVESLELAFGPLPEPFRSARLKESDPITMTRRSMEECRQDRIEGGSESFLANLVRQDHGYGTSMEPCEILGPNEKDVGAGVKWVTLRIPEREADQLLDLLTKIFKYSPSERLSASDVMAHPWIRDHAMTLEGLAEPDNVPVHGGLSETVDIEVAEEKAADEPAPVETIAGAKEIQVSATPAVGPMNVDAEVTEQEEAVGPQRNGVRGWFAWIGWRIFHGCV